MDGFGGWACVWQRLVRWEQRFGVGVAGRGPSRFRISKPEPDEGSGYWAGVIGSAFISRDFW